MYLPNPLNTLNQVSYSVIRGLENDRVEHKWKFEGGVEGVYITKTGKTCKPIPRQKSLSLHLFRCKPHANTAERAKLSVLG